jgi:hypothetical protein
MPWPARHEPMAIGITNGCLEPNARYKDDGAHRTERSGSVAKAPKSALRGRKRFGAVPRPRVNWRIPHHASRRPRRDRNTTALCAWHLHRHTGRRLRIRLRGLQVLAGGALVAHFVVVVRAQHPPVWYLTRCFDSRPALIAVLCCASSFSHHIFAARLLASLITIFTYSCLFACLPACCWILSV